MRGNLYRRLAELCYRLNGGLDGLHNGSALDRLAFYFWARAYRYR